MKSYGTFDLTSGEEKTASPSSLYGFFKTTADAAKLVTPVTGATAAYGLLNFFSYENIKETAQIFKETVIADIFGDVIQEPDQIKSAECKR